MLDIKFIKENLSLVQEISRLKHCAVAVEECVLLADECTEKTQQWETLRSEQNKKSKELGQLMREGKKDEAAGLQQELRTMAEELKDLGESISEKKKKLQYLQERIPNVAHPDVPRGEDASTNVVVRTWGEKRAFSFMPKDHLAVAENLGMLDMKRAGKITGSGFGLYFDKGALLERALINFMLDFHVRKHGYIEVHPPFLVNRDSMFGTGQLPKLEEDMYCTKEDDLFLIPTAEVPVTNIHRGELLYEKDLPIYYVSYTPCFRREAGSYGKDTRGITRVHQFNKVEMVKFVVPETSYEEHEKLLHDAEDILQALGLPYRIVLLSAGDMSFAAAKCYDIEVWAPGSDRWLEVSSCSNFEDFQARRADIRYRPKEGGKTRFVHTLNASGIALPRTVIGILENFQNEDGTITIPDVLKPYMER